MPKKDVLIELQRLRQYVTDGGAIDGAAALAIIEVARFAWITRHDTPKSAGLDKLDIALERLERSL